MELMAGPLRWSLLCRLGFANKHETAWHTRHPDIEGTLAVSAGH